MYAQNKFELNSNLNLPDSLTNKTEIRIYKGGGITNYSSLIRIYKNDQGRWIVEFYRHFTKVKGKEGFRSVKRILMSKNDMELVWNNILRTNIQFLPNMAKIKYKMRERGNIQFIDGEYQLLWKTKVIMDGVGYKVQIKSFNIYNEVAYGNPESYLKHYQDVDELIYFTELLNLIRQEFEIWKK